MPKIVDHGERRRAIAATAVRVISERGFGSASIREIAAASEFSRGVIEHYFASKQDLIATALDWANEEYSKRAEKAVAGLSGLRSLQTRLENIVPLNKPQRMEWKVRLQFWALAAIEPAFQKEQSRRFEQARQDFHRHLKEARRLGELGAALSLAEASDRLVYFVTGISVASMQSPDGYPPKVMRRAIRSHLDALRA